MIINFSQLLHDNLEISLTIIENILIKILVLKIKGMFFFAS